VELSKQVVELGKSARVLGIGRPEASRQRPVPSLEVIDDFVEVPRECEHVGVLLCRKFGVNTESGILIGVVELAITRILL